MEFGSQERGKVVKNGGITLPDGYKRRLKMVLKSKLKSKNKNK